MRLLPFVSFIGLLLIALQPGALGFPRFDGDYSLEDHRDSRSFREEHPQLAAQMDRDRNSRSAAHDDLPPFVFVREAKAPQGFPWIPMSFREAKAPQGFPWIPMGFREAKAPQGFPWFPTEFREAKSQGLPFMPFHMRDAKSLETNPLIFRDAEPQDDVVADVEPVAQDPVAPEAVQQQQQPQPTKQEPVQQEPVKQEPVKQEPVKQTPVKTQEPTKQEPVKETPVKQPVKQVAQEPVKQEQTKTVQEPTKSVQEPVKTVQEPVKQVTTEKVEVSAEHSTCTTCVKAKPDFSKAIAIAVKGNALAAVATAKVAAIPVIKSAKIAALASLIPVKLAAKGALIGGLIAKPIVISSAITGATAAKLSYLFVGKPIAIGADLLAGAEALRAKLAAKKAGCTTCD